MRMLLRYLIVSTLLFAGTATAGSQPAAGPSLFSEAELAAFSKQVEEAAAARGARVFLIARQGRPQEELPPGIVFTHTAIAVYSTIRTQDGRTLQGYAIHNLYQTRDDPKRSELVQDYPIDFFRGAYALKTGIIIPTPELQQRLLELIGTDTYRGLHNPRYSAVANPYTPMFQNCTEFVLDVLQAAIYRTGDVATIKANSRAYYKAPPLRVSTLKLALGALAKDEVSLLDHQGEAVRTATFDSIADYLAGYGLVQERLLLTASR